MSNNGDTNNVYDILSRYKKGHREISFTKLCDKAELPPSKVEEALKQLKKEGYNIQVSTNNKVHLSKELQNRGTISHAKPSKRKNRKTYTIKFGAIGDNHLGSKYENLDILHEIYDKFKSLNIKTVYNTANWIDGEARFNRYDIHTHGVSNQVQYFIKNYPQREGIITKYIAGDDHEGWYTKQLGLDVGLYAEMEARKAGRKDLEYLAYMEHDVVYDLPEGNIKIRVLHPGGGSSYAISYKPQKIVESYSVSDDIDVLLIGHYHKLSYNKIRGIHVFQTGTTQHQTPFMRKKNLAAHLGAWVIEMEVDQHGNILEIIPRMLDYYDTEIDKEWKYKFN